MGFVQQKNSRCPLLRELSSFRLYGQLANCPYVQQAGSNGLQRSDAPKFANLELTNQPRIVYDVLALSRSRGWTATGTFTSRRGPGEGSIGSRI